MNEIEIWWTSLPITEKERIARKGLSKSGRVAVDEADVLYPACTRWWNSLESSRKVKIHDHCVLKHGDELKEWDEANPYGD
ncbi:MAG: hypothetical protein IJ151_09555 [Bacteroidales bacterium]|nr:hypothetical protein [Bacteroidales bacterium]MBQ9186096.1 hypothetical protein [Bacteroidales bacterium]